MGKVVKGIGKGIKGAAKAVGGAIVGKKGDPGRGPGFLNEELEQQNLDAAKKVGLLTGQIQDQQGRQLSAIEAQLLGVGAEPIQTAEQAKAGAGTISAAEIERRRRALAQGGVAASRNIQQGVARRGLSGSAAGLFAQARQNQVQQNALADLDTSRFGFQAGLENEALDRRQAEIRDRFQREASLRGQLGNIYGQAQQLTPKFMDEGVAATPGQMGLLQRVGRDVTRGISGEYADKAAKGIGSFFSKGISGVVTGYGGGGGGGGGQMVYQPYGIHQGADVTAGSEAKRRQRQAALLGGYDVGYR